MTHNEAVSAITLLKECPDLNYDDISKGFQIALALFDEPLVIFFKERYYHFIYNITLDIALHIDKPGKIELFKQYEIEWEMISYCYSELVLIAIMHKLTQHSPEADIFVCQLIDKYLFESSYYQNKFSNLLEKSIDELTVSYLDCPQGKISRSLAYIYYYRALDSSDVVLLEEAIHKAEAEKDEDMVSRLQRRVASCKANENIVDALDIATSIKCKESKKFALYDIAKNIHERASKSSSHIVSFLPTMFQYGFRAFLASFNKDKNEVMRIMEEIEKLHETHFISNDTYDNCLMQIAYSVVENYPHLVSNIREKLHTLWGEILDIEVEVAVSLSKKDLEEGITYALSIDVDFFQVDSIVRIIESVEDESSLVRLSKITEHYYENVNFQYDILKAINKKMPLPFEQVWNVTSKMLPYKY